MRCARRLPSLRTESPRSPTKLAGKTNSFRSGMKRRSRKMLGARPCASVTLKRRAKHHSVSPLKTNLLESKASNTSYMERISQAKKEAEQKPEWDKSVTSEKRNANIEDRMASKIAMEVLRDNAKLRAVHSGNSIKHLLEREAKK